MRTVLSDNGALLVVDEFPQQAPIPESDPNKRSVDIMIKRADVLMPLFSIGIRDLIKWADSSGLECIAIGEVDIHREKGYHPPITGLLFRPYNGSFNLDLGRINKQRSSSNWIIFS
ncbi:MAG: hypothetical protein N2746_02580 [Deltaproteobacteria bacterium]|nr:hypothetical protein [Deltaproteobacteria bacterium]